MLKNIVFFLFFIVTGSIVQSGQDLRCVVTLQFASDQKGSIANYILNLQLKNTTGRNITGASILYKNDAMEIIGNSFLECGAPLGEIKPGSYGNCEAVLQKVDGQFIVEFGTEKWTEIVNTQLSYLNNIQYCELLGFSY